MVWYLKPNDKSPNQDRITRSALHASSASTNWTPPILLMDLITKFIVSTVTGYWLTIFQKKSDEVILILYLKGHSRPQGDHEVDAPGHDFYNGGKYR